MVACHSIVFVTCTYTGLLIGETLKHHLCNMYHCVTNMLCFDMNLELSWMTFNCALRKNEGRHGIPSYLRGIKYPGIFQSYHLENTPHSSRILRQLVCTVTCMGFNGISESFFHLKTSYEALFCSQCITLLQ